jgi:GxxExxY protein
MYDGVPLKSPLRLDLIVEGEVIVELKAIDDVLGVHRAQLLSYLRLANKKLGLLLNFNVVLLKHGIHRIVNKL